MRLFQAALDTPLDRPFFASLSVRGLHFTVYAPSKNVLNISKIVPDPPSNTIFRHFTMVSKPRFKIPGEAEVKLRFKRGQNEVKLR